MSSLPYSTSYNPQVPMIPPNFSYHYVPYCPESPYGLAQAPIQVITTAPCNNDHCRCHHTDKPWYHGLFSCCSHDHDF